ncbi:MAG: hypothetical protein EOS58_11450 [Mesorhizobium sp.]|uniref:hypothetical protein n=1 Tax=unclassified Mesorhizobium TaxID=325217 RepID=UPI000F754A5F|nr:MULTISPECIES: hypothetical protein [unclassified Mesorhizobium]RVD68952.1 hypothetical protein EN751_28620 [Mesorhizobium sp. M4A.F.Ca.ET.029.04.2.1]AZO49254.1 hypothetical protein EJ073_16690 [Mesorhizobium sp. M4B.F.Ca.ET.058.02.1.1]RUX51360.1 hypothetical protein EOA33_06635 [Mesorhizobium sp. M4A.F.Ca.ET.050.02.1.1]RVC41859.1 hypothetical protein EN781_24535 [Mesorhizobium sp. M4A.F.Ca.ET.090.04.2.1]RVD39669.1 hypothetical protein EN742_14615 [Mesorhizobium sp. M4A.F.Ca.ET.020.02.1.1]
MRWKIMVLASCLATAGCVGGTSMSERQDEDVQSSLQYDNVPCDQLIAQRNALAEQSQLPTTAKTTFSNPAMGFGPFTPDMRSKARRDADKAAGQIDAMNRSIERRDCGKPAKKNKFELPGSKPS